MEWQPIESAPKDGSWFQAWVMIGKDEVWQPYCRYAEDGRFQMGGPVTSGDMAGAEFFPYAKPTHWMPIPGRPTELV